MAEKDDVMGKVQNRVPRLRFPGFEGDNFYYRHYFFKDIFLFSTGKNIKQREASPEFETPCIRYGELYHMYNEVIVEVFNKTNLEKAELLFSNGNEILLPSAGEDPLDIGSASALTIKNVAIGRTINILKPAVPNLYCQRYVSYYINNRLKATIAKLAKGVSISNVYNSDLKTLSITLPRIEEQLKISYLLSLIDNRIATQNKIIEALKRSKCILVKKIFSRQINFTDAEGNRYSDWILTKLGDVTTLVNRRNKNNEKLPVYSINNKQGFVSQNEQFDGMDSEERGYDISLYKIIGKNTFAYNPARINVGSIGYSGDLCNIIISSLYVCFITKEMVDNNFLFQYLKTELFNNEVLKNVEGGVRNYLFYENFARIELYIPVINEQVKIAGFLDTIDKKIETEKNILKSYLIQKTNLLSHLFI